MAVPEQIPVVNYVADGIVEKFDVPFEYDQQSDLHIYIDGVEPTIDKYFFADNSFNFYIAPTAGQDVKIKRITPKERDTDYNLHTNTVRPKALNTDFDRLWYVLQEVFSDVGGLSQAVQDEIIARIQGDEDLLNQLTAEISARMLGDEAVTEDLKNYVNQVVGAIINDPTFDGIDADKVNDASGETQQQVNYNGGSKWHSRAGGYKENELAVLSNGDIVKSTIDGNTNDPNVDTTGWVKTNSASQIFDESGKTQQDINNDLAALDGDQHLQFNNELNKDGSSSTVQKFIDVLSNKRNIAEPTDHYRPIDEVIFDGSDFYFDGNGAELECTVNRRAITGYNSPLGNQKFTILNTYIKQQWNPDTGSGGANNNAPIHLNGLKNPRVFFNLFESSVGVSTNVATVEGINHGAEFAHIMFNHFRDVQKQCVETFGSSHNIVVGNSGDVPLLNSNALRLTGAESPTIVYNKASVYAANTFKGGQGATESGKYAAGISVQTHTQGASAVANASQGFHWGVNLKGGTTLQNQSRGNYVQHSNVDSDFAVYSESPRSQQLNITAYNFKEGGIKEVTTNNSATLLKGVMKYDGILVAGPDTTAAALDILNDGSQFNILVDLQDGGNTQRNILRGKNHSGIISVYGSDNGAIFLRCNDSNLQITVKDIDDTSNNKVAVRIYGNNNTVTVNTKGSVRFEETATGNVLLGSAGRVECLSTTSNNTFYGKSAASGGFGVNGNTHSNPLDYIETYDPESIPANGSIIKTVTMNGVSLGQQVVAAFSVYNPNIELYPAVSATNTVTVKLKNTSAIAVDLSSGTLAIKRL